MDVRWAISINGGNLDSGLHTRCVLEKMNQRWQNDHTLLVVMNMPKTLSWDSCYSVGDATLDKQHKKLMNLCNKLATSANHSGVQSDALFRKVLDELSAYAREHFATEEAILEACAYPRLATQKWDHSEYEQQVAEALASASDSRLDKAGLQRLLSNWWRDHILISDMDYRQHVLDFNMEKRADRPELAYFSGVSVIALRKSRQLSQEAFWSKLGVSRSSGAAYEHGREIPETVQMLLQLAHGSDDQADELLRWMRAPAGSR